jgi:hypothetical protein
VICAPPATTLARQATLCLAVLFVPTALVLAENHQPADDMAFFTEKIQPILKDRCLRMSLA